MLYFCSIKCSVLKEEPLNVFKESLGKNKLKHDEPIKVNDQVVISGIISEKCLYVRRADIDDSRLMNSVLKHSKRAQRLDKFPAIGDLVVADWMSEVYRAKVINVSSEKPYAISVQLVDFGNTARVFLKDLMIMGPECQRLQCSAQKVLLKDVKVEAINMYIIDYLNEFLDGKTELAIASMESGESVLTDKSTGSNINRRIVELSLVEDASFYVEGVTFSEFKVLMDSESRLTCVPFYGAETLISLEPNQKLFVVNSQPFVEYPEIICCVSKSNMKDFRELYRSINVYAINRKSTVSGIPMHDKEMCLAYCNNQWHRAVVLKTEGDGRPKCLLIDLWSVQMIEVSKIIPMPKVFRLPPPLCVHCKYTADVDVQENDWLNVDEVLHGEDGFCVLIMK